MFSHGSERSAGVLALKNKFSGDVLHYYCDPCCNFIFLVLCISNIFIILVNIYGFNSLNEHKALFEMIENKIVFWLNKYPSSVLCMGGDFNIAPDNMLDRMPPKNAPCNLL